MCLSQLNASEQNRQDFLVVSFFHVFCFLLIVMVGLSYISPFPPHPPPRPPPPLPPSPSHLLQPMRLPPIGVDKYMTNEVVMVIKGRRQDLEKLLHLFSKVYVGGCCCIAQFQDWMFFQTPTFSQSISHVPHWEHEKDNERTVAGHWQDFTLASSYHMFMMRL